MPGAVALFTPSLHAIAWKRYKMLHYCENIVFVDMTEKF